MVMAPPIAIGVPEVRKRVLGGPMSVAELPERRRREATAHVRFCRLCWRPVEVDGRYLEVTEQHVYAHCGHCGGSFPIRHSDLETLAPTGD